MHILITNDDGPPSSQSSPYVHSLVRHLESEGHTVSVCLPHAQRSWIGKAHMIGQTLKPTYYRPSPDSHGDNAVGTTHPWPSSDSGVEEWVLVDGTPASCVQVGLHHFFQEKGQIDLVLSGPNYGRNSTAVFALSSGTLGAALEAAACQKKAIALSFAFFSRNHDPEIIDAACRHSVKVVETLYKQWPSDRSADLYSVNVPLVEGVETHKTLWTKMLQNYWSGGSCFQEIEGEADNEAEEEQRIREEEARAAGGEKGGNRMKLGHKHKHLKWAPRFSDVYKSVEEAGPGNDGWTVQSGQTSVTPMKANFAMSADLAEGKEIKLYGTRHVVVSMHLVRAVAYEEEISGSSSTKKLQVERIPPLETSNQLRATIIYDDPYVQPLILTALKDIIHDSNLDISTKLSEQPDSTQERTLQIVSYERIDFDRASSHPGTFLVNSYMIRKALIRKHYLSTTVEHWTAKNPTSLLKTHFKRSEAFEVDYAEFLDDALIEAFDLRESMDRNARLEMSGSEGSEKEWWILKPGMSDRGQGIKLFSTMKELQAIFDKWEEDQPDTDNEEDDAGEARTQLDDEEREEGDNITASHLRHFVAQPYIHPPLLLPNDKRKFHIRTYVLCVGALTVYVYKPMLALFAAKEYSAPWVSQDDIESFLTNTCLQSSPNENTVHDFWDLDHDLSKMGEPFSEISCEQIFEQICQITGEAFEAAARAMPIHFQPLPNAFEVFGLDYMVDANGVVYLLEVNAFPDFKQTGGGLKDIVGGFWKGVVKEAVAPFFGLDTRTQAAEGMVKVKEIDLGRR